jgi:hypothetical protein
MGFPLERGRVNNVPPARIPGDGAEPLDDLPAEAETIRAALLDAFDRQRQADLAARLVARHLTLGHSPQALVGTLAHACYAKTRASTHTRWWRPGSASSRLGAAATRVGASSLRSLGISRLIRQLSAHNCRPLTSLGA